MLGRNVFEVGEVRRMEYIVRSSVPNDCIVVTSATWTLTNLNTNETVQSGVCTVSDTLITAVFSATTLGTYVFELTAVIPPETLIERTFIEVVR